jgi:hypothetical protein
MAIVIPGSSKCPLCGGVIDDTKPYRAFAAFLPNSHKLAILSDAAVHQDCLDHWSDSVEFLRLYDEFRKLWSERPSIPHGMSMSDFEKTTEYASFQNKLRNFV